MGGRTSRAGSARPTQSEVVVAEPRAAAANSRPIAAAIRGGTMLPTCGRESNQTMVTVAP